MKTLLEYINEQKNNEEINEGFLLNLFGKLGSFLTKKFSISNNSSKELTNTMNTELDALNKDIMKVSKGKVKDFETWWKLYTRENKNASKVNAPMTFNQAILKNTANVVLPFKKMVESYTEAGIINNTIICSFIFHTVKQYISVIESIVKDNSKKVNCINQLSNLSNYLSGVSISDNEDAEKYIKDSVSELSKNAKKFLSKYKK